MLQNVATTRSSSIGWLLLWLCFSLSVSLAFVRPVSAAAPRPDTDGDGLTDSFERRIGTNPYDQDTDHDGFLDARELWNGWSPTSSAPITMNKSIHVDLKAQRLYFLVDGIVIREHIVSTGKASTPTPKGEFTILNKVPRAWSRLARLWMPYWMGLSAKGYGLHELPEWPGGFKEGANHLGNPVSHGCIRLAVGAAEELYHWAPMGMKVVIQ